MASIPSNYAAMWNLNPIIGTSEESESAFGLGPGGQESVLGKDGRTLVDARQYADGGKYRSIIKLMIRYENQPDDNNWGMGTGWLIGPDLLVTAGHCAFDFGEQNYGRAVIVKAFMGYSGKASLTPANLSSGAVQQRMGKTFITTAGWLQSKGSERRTDVSFLKLDRPFTGNFQSFHYADTPSSGTDTIGVVGYPADKPNDAEEKGSRMYEMFAQTKWNLIDNKRNMLAYPISTYPGQSGSPVIRKFDGVSIGAHVYGGESLNSASTISGQYGNNFDAYVDIFNQRAQPVATILGVSVVKPFDANQSNIDLTNGGFVTQGFAKSGSAENFLTQESGLENFWDTLKDITKITIPLVSTGMQIASPFLGPAGPPAAGIAGIALGALGKMCESAFDNQSQTLRMVPRLTPKELKGIAERAVLAESLLQTILKLAHNSPEAKLILQTMQTTYVTMEPQKVLPSKLFPCIAVPVLRIAMDSKLPVQAGTAVHVRKALPNSAITESESTFTSTEAAFARELLQPTIGVPGEEGFFDLLGPIITTGLKFASPLLSQVAKQGVDFALSSLSSTESAFDGDSSDNALAEPLFRRAVVAECAILAVQKIDPARLKDLQLYDENEHEIPERFFDDMKKTMQIIGRKIIESAPDVIRNVGPVASNLISSAIEEKRKTESAMGNGLRSPNLTIPASHPTLRTRRSIGALAENRATTPKLLSGMA